MTSQLKLSILDQSVAVEGRSHADSIQATLALARQAESWGYHRFWVSEHTATPPSLASRPRY